MKYVSDSRKDKKGKHKKPNLPNIKPNRAAMPSPQPTITERDGVRVNISSAVKSAQLGNKPPKKTMDRELLHSIIVKSLIGLAIAVAVAAVMFLVYYFANSSEDVQTVPTLEGFPALVAGINVESTPASVVSLSPLLTDMCKTLPLNNPLVAVSNYCVNDGDLPTVGTSLLPDIDAIIALDAQYLITLTPLTLRQKISLEQTGTKILEFDMPTNFSGFTDLASELATLYMGKEDGPDVGDGIYGRFSDSLALYSTTINKVTDERPTYSLLFDLSGSSATSDTREAQIFSSILGQTAVTGVNYSTTLDQVISADPQVLILPNTVSMDDLAGTGLDTGTAAQNSHIFFIDMSALETFSPTILFDVARIAATVYPQLNLI